MPDPVRHIAHIDLDCFFVSVERIKDPSLNGKPVAVGGSATGRGVVASASYEARKFGVHSAMPASRALRLCPHLILISGHHGDYAEHSRRLYRRMLDIAPLVERASIDEMYLDFTGCESLYGNDLPGYMKKLQELIKAEFQLPCTIALASNKLVAKIAANTVKPAGVIAVPAGTEKEFLAPLPIGVLPGVGTKTEAFLTARGFRTVADLQAVPLATLVSMLGAHGEWLHNAGNGRGSAVLQTHHVAKSISREETFARDISSTEELEKILFTLVEDVCSTLRAHSWKAETVTLKVRTSHFETLTRRQSTEATNYDPAVLGAVKKLLQKVHDGRTPLRLLGVGLSNFVDDSQGELELFPSSGKREKVLQAVDRLRRRFGDGSVKIGSM